MLQQIHVSAEAGHANPSWTIRATTSRERMGTKSWASFRGAFPTESTGVGERLCSSRRVADHGPVPSQVLFYGAPFIRDRSKQTVLGTSSETLNCDPGFLTDSLDAILLKELKSIVQEHSIDRSFFQILSMWG